ncbi:aluminum-activated malate transporter 8-like [Capsicum annuum]
MEINSTYSENIGVFIKWWSEIKDIFKKIKKKAEKIIKNIKQIGKDDPRKFWHAFKVGLAVTLVSLFYYVEPLFHSFDQLVMLAILTVAVAFEFTAGATISKNINRGIGTTLAGAFGLGAKYLAELIGKKGPDPITLGILVFIVGALGTFIRFYHSYDYGITIFVLTFITVAVSGYRSEDIFQLTHQRISLIFIAVFTIIIISMVIRPVWAGEDLHKLISTNLEKLASFLEGFESEHLHISKIKSVEGTKNNEKKFLESFLSIFDSKTTEESLANFAWWEPPHGTFKFNHPWRQYLKIGDLIRKCACHLLALNSHVNFKSQVPTEFERRTEEGSKRMIVESKNALKELALSIQTMTQPISSIIHIRNAKNVIDDLKHTLGTSKTFFQHDECVMDFVPAASVASLLIDVTKCIDEISEAVEELSSKAHFEKKKNDSCSTEDDIGSDFVTIDIADNVESPKRVEIEEVNRVNNPINAIKGEYFIIWIRGNTATTVVEETNMSKNKGDFMIFTNIKLYDSTQFFELVEVKVLEEANRVNNPLAARKEEYIVIGICGNTIIPIVEEMQTAEKKEDF